MIDAMKRVQVVFTDEQWSMVERLRGFMGSNDSELVRNIVLAWLSEKSILLSELGRRGGKGE